MIAANPPDMSLAVVFITFEFLIKTSAASFVINIVPPDYKAMLSFINVWSINIAECIFEVSVYSEEI